MTRRNASFDELIKKTATWAEIIVKQDPEWRDYSGIGPYGEELANIDTALKFIIKDPNLTILLKLRRAQLLQQRKAHFAGTLANQITMLAMLKGSRGETLSVSERIFKTTTTKPIS